MRRATGCGTPSSSSSGRGACLMLTHQLNRQAPKRRITSYHFPERHAKRVQIRADVDPTPANCSGLANSGVPAKPPSFEIAL
jgi:hypothetical protein